MAGARPTQAVDTSELRARVAQLGDRVSALEAAIGDAAGLGATELPTDHFVSLVEHARLDLDLLANRADHAFRAADIAAREQIAWERAAIAAGQIGRQLEVELDTIEAELAVHRSDDGEAEEAWRAVGESWRARADELRVQANLARRDLQDQANANVDRVEEAVDGLRSAIEDLRDRTGRQLTGLIERARVVARETGRGLVDEDDDTNDTDDTGATP
jgi:chromosome segregation ATPase